MALPTVVLEVNEGEDMLVIERVVAPDGTDVVQAGVAANGVDVRAFDLTAGSEDSLVWAALGLSPAAGGFLTALTLDGRWTRNGDGFTYAYNLLASSADFEGGKTFRVEVTVRLLAGGVLIIPREFRVAPQVGG